MEDWAGIQSSSIMERILLCVCCFSGWFVSTCCPRQYHYVDDAKTWTEAQSYCQQTHTDLASIENTEEMKQLNSTVSSAAHSSELWIGLYSQIRWRWSDGLTGSGADYRNWDTSEYEPDFYSGVQFCVSSLKGKWWDFQCREKLQFICYRGSQMNPEFDLVDKEMSWSDARRYCRENFLDLATVKNPGENQQVHEKAQSKGCGLACTESHTFTGLMAQSTHSQTGPVG
ncbi:macrophage mannose receptor 1-like [Oreochromis aureus]|nr:macrophage mannose receptor 1-like [Oreochromis aureus]